MHPTLHHSPAHGDSQMGARMKEELEIHPDLRHSQGQGPALASPAPPADLQWSR